MIVKTRELSGRHLDYAVAKSLGYEIADFSRKTSPIYINVDKNHFFVAFNPSENGEQCGCFIDKYGLNVEHESSLGITDEPGYYAISLKDTRNSNVVFKNYQFGETPQIAICRAVVFIELGDEIEIPDELME